MTKKSLPLTLFAGVAVLAATHTAQADLTREGAVGLPLNPTAQLPSAIGVRVQGNYFDGGDAKIAGLYAAGRLSNWEISGGLENVNGDNQFDSLDKSSLAIGVKYLLSKAIPVPNPTGVQVAAGIGYSHAQFRNTYGYLVTTAKVPFLGGTYGHLGVRYDNFDTNLPLLDGQSKTSVYGGVEIPVTRDGRFIFIGELQSKNSDNDDSKAPYSAGLRYRAGVGFSASAGVMRDGFTGESGLYAQIGKSF